MTNHTVIRNIMSVFNIIKTFVDKNDYKDSVKTLYREHPDIMFRGKIARVVSNLIITPLVVVDKELQFMDQKDFKNTVKTEVNIFTSIFVEAVRILLDLYAVDLKTTLEIVTRPPDFISFKTISRVRELSESLEDYNYRDYIKELMENDGRLDIIYTTESDKIKQETNKYVKDTNTYLNVYELQIKTSDGRVLVIPFIIHPQIRYVESETFLVNILDSKHGKTFYERWLDFRAGVIDLFNLVFPIDLIKEYKKRKIKNRNDLAEYLNRLDNFTTVKEVLHNRSFFYRNYNLYIFSSNRIPLIESILKGKIIKDNYKQQLLDSLFAFSVSFVDVEKRELMTFVDSIPGFGILTFDMLAKDKESDVAKVVRELLNNRPPF